MSNSRHRNTHHLALVDMQNKLANDLPESLNILVNGPETSGFNSSYAKLDSWKNQPTNKGIYEPRILITMSDGRTVVDTNKGYIGNVKATKSDPVNENHNTRPVIFRAINENGPQFELKVSNSTGKEELRCSLRMGNDIEEPIGVVSISTTLPEKKDISTSTTPTIDGSGGGSSGGGGYGGGGYGGGYLKKLEYAKM